MIMQREDDSQSLYARIRRVAEAHGDAPAIVYGESVVDYGALLEQAHRLATALAAALGRDAHRLVAILGKPRPEFVASMLAVLENGWTYLPLDGNHPKLRNEAILADAGADAVIVLGRGGEVEITGVGERALRPEERAKLSDRAYVMYTSGSTGAPKGSAASVAAVLNFVDFMRERFAFGASSAMLSVTNFAWDAAVSDIYTPLTAGGRIVLVPHDQLGDVAAIARLLDRHEIDLMLASPSMWKMIVDSGWAGRAALTVLTGGEALPEALARALLPRCRALWNLYGPVECTVCVTCMHVREPTRISLGFPLPRTGLHILRDDGTPAGPREPGEIVISGIGLANGYLHRPELTAEKFIELETPAGKVAAYRTGDQGYLTEEGELWFSGRRDLMLKIRGHRVEAQEVEDHLERHPAIRQAVVFGRQGSVSDTLCAVLVASAPIDARAVREYLHERVPEFMIPSEIGLRDDMPLNANAKLDRRRVMAEFLERPARTSVTPRDPYELELLQMVSEVSAVPVGLDDPLFDGALHSLAMVGLAQRINARIDGTLTFADLQQNPTVTRLAAFLRRAPTSEFRQIIQLKEGTTRRTLVLFHPAGGTCLPYKPLVDQLPAELTVLGVECPNLYRPRPEVFTVEEMVERYYPEVARVESEGPIGLAGWSLGGYLGYETARRLRAAGRGVGLLLLMDPTIMDEQLQAFARLAPVLNMSKFLSRHVLAGYWEHLNDEERERQRTMYELARDGELTYRPGRYEGDMVLVKADRFNDVPPGSDMDRMQQYMSSLPYNGWEKSCTGQIRVVRTPTTHNDLVSPASAPMLAALIAEHLR